MCLVLLSTLSPSLVSAHSNEKSFEQKVGQYKIDVGYEPSEFEDNSPATFDFNISDTKTGEDVDFTDAWVRIESGNTTFFATGVFKQSLGATTLVYTFPKPGNYNLYVRFENKENQIAETTIPITVISNSEQATGLLFQNNITGMGVLLGVAVGLILMSLGLFINKSLKTRRHDTKKGE